MLKNILFRRATPPPREVSCPKCGFTMELREIPSGWSHACPAGCGIWLDKASINAVNRSREAQTTQPTGVWRSRRLLRGG